MKNNCTVKPNEHGFALITAIMMLFAATVMGLMVMNSSEIEILLSGAQQRYENNINVADGATIVEALTNYNYPEADDAIVSPRASDDINFDPGGDLPEVDPYVVLYDRKNLDDETKTTPLGSLPVGNLMQSINHNDDQFDYHYRTICVKRIKTTTSGNDASGDQYDTYWQTDIFNGSNIEIGYKTTGK